MIPVDQQREIRQLMYVASCYLQSASLAKGKTRKLGSTAFAFIFDRGRGPDPESKELALLGGHLSSTAIRLATVEKILNKANITTDAYNACKVYFYCRKGGRPRSAVFPNYRNCLHVLLRDSIGHEEPDETDNREQVKRWRERQRCLKDLTFDDAYQVLKKIDQRLRDYLTGKGMQLLAR